MVSLFLVSGAAGGGTFSAKAEASADGQTREAEVEAGKEAEVEEWRHFFGQIYLEKACCHRSSMRIFCLCIIGLGPSPCTPYITLSPLMPSSFMSGLKRIRGEQIPC